MAWHVKKHGDGTKYEKLENIDKLKWVQIVVLIFILEENYIYHF